MMRAYSVATLVAIAAGIVCIITAQSTLVLAVGLGLLTFGAGAVTAALMTGVDQ
ncbi:hypothetical protein AB4Y87_19845 [Paenarthrobacter sp. RAF54_2]|uniref:hypothetical protein n=1 Tax=Paenarthrobacter sp. RAF54_2 TaxID=3233061 RepID=UPI003F9C20C7